ncbi:MAG TPA: phosphoribosylanthranilate isomerase [Bacillales bacterium]|nr:phosphoribosylanthranilate isomerase [Bacillales bacterium]
MTHKFKVKYCGNHSLQDLHYTANSRADYLGFIFSSVSKRCVSAEQVSGWVQEVPPKNGQKLVGLFVNSSAEEINAVVNRVPLDIIQCHGLETPELVHEISAVTGLPVWKAIHHDDHALDRMKAYEGKAEGFVVDCKVKGQWGGTGKSFDWTVVPEYTAEAKRQGVPCFIAGGVRAGNVSELLRYKPEGIDISSGIERDGDKNQEEISRLEERMNIDEAELS